MDLFSLQNYWAQTPTTLRVEKALEAIEFYSSPHYGRNCFNNISGEHICVPESYDGREKSLFDLNVK